MNWDTYARVTAHDERFYAAEPVQRQRLDVMARRSRGRALDVGAADGLFAAEIGADAADISEIRVDRARARGVNAFRADACALPCADGSYDTVLLGEILEHLDNPGRALAEACRVAKERVVVSLPLNGWEDPTHQWRISLDVLTDDMLTAQNPTKGQQIVLTFQRGCCWPHGYWQTDTAWQQQFGEGH